MICMYSLTHFVSKKGSTATPHHKPDSFQLKWQELVQDLRRQIQWGI